MSVVFFVSIRFAISFKNFYNYSGDYENNTYEFSEGINVVNADNGMGKSKLFNGFLWILRDKVYDSDSRTTIDITTSPLKILSARYHRKK